MSALTTAFAANALIYSVQTAAFAYLYARRRERAVGMWLCGSALLLCFAAVALILDVANRPEAELPCLLLLLAAGSCIADGTLHFVGRPLPRAAWPITLACGAWAAIAGVAGVPLKAAALPAGLWLPVLMIFGGVRLLRSPHGALLGGRIAGFVMIAWGLHFADYPLLREIEWFAPAGFLIAGMLDLLVALGLFVLHFEVARTRAAQLEAQLAEARKLEALGRVTGGIAHDFNNLLTVIMSGTQLVSRAQNLTDRQRAMLADTAEASERAAALTGQLLAFSRRQPQRSKVIDVVQTVRKMTGLLSALTGGGVELRVREPTSAQPVELDPSQLNQVLLNLVINARDAMPDGGTISLEIRRADADTVEITVSDSGSGMSPDIVTKAFEPFFTTKHDGKGTGLGLSIVHGIITRAGGSVAIESEPERGTTVRVHLPVGDASRVVDEQEVAVVPGTGTVLVAEDEPLLRKAAAEILQRGGYEVIEAADGEAALRAFERHGSEIDALVTDIVMPGLGGLDLARALCDTTPHLPVVITSGFPDRIETSSEPLDPRHEFLPKPYTPDALMAAVACAVRRAQRAHGRATT